MVCSKRKSEPRNKRNNRRCFESKTGITEGKPLSAMPIFHALNRSKTVVTRFLQRPHYARFCPVMLSSNPLQVPVAVTNEKYLRAVSTENVILQFVPKVV